MTRIPRHLAILVLGLASAAADGAASADPIARHAALVAEGQKIAAEFLRLEGRREAYDRATTAGPEQAAAIAKAIAQLNADNTSYADAAKALAAEVKAHNARCGAKAVKSDAPRTAKTKAEADAARAEIEAAKTAEATRVADCEANAQALAERGTTLDAEQASLKTRHSELDAEVKASNASIDEQEALGRKLADELTTVEDAAEGWLERFNAVLAAPAFAQRATGVEGCKARREMVVSAKDLQTFVRLHQTCASNLAR